MRYKIKLADSDGIYLMWNLGEYRWGTGDVIYWTSESDAEDVINKISEIHGEKWKPKMYIVSEYYTENYEGVTPENTALLFNGWEHCLRDFN